VGLRPTLESLLRSERTIGCQEDIVRSTRISLVIVSSLAVVGVAGSPASAIRAVPIDWRGLSSSVVVQIPRTVGVDARGNTLGRRVPPFQGNAPTGMPSAVAVDAQGMNLGRRVAPIAR
jgi:hypothetical protein